MARRSETGPDPTRQAGAGAWCWYNWADHGWATPIAAVLVGPWMLALAVAAVGKRGVLVGVGPLVLHADAFPSAMITLAAIVQLVALPLVGARVDTRGAKRRWLVGSCLVGSGICIALGATHGADWIAAGLLFLAGSLVEGVSDLTWQGMLPELADDGAGLDALSARGTAVGYLGAGVVLAVELAVVDLHAELGVTKETAVRACFALAGLWWLGFGLPALLRLAPAARGRAIAPEHTWRRLRADWRVLAGERNAARYLLAYLCFGDAMSAVIALASTFLTNALFHDDTTKATPFLFELILMIQFVAMGGAVAAGRLARRFGAKAVLVASLVLWSAVIVYAYAGLHDELDAVIAGAIIGVGLGVTAALARSLFASMIPVGREASFFSIYEVTSQGTAFFAPLLFTVVVDITGSFRQAILSLIVLFVLGLVLLARTDTDAASAAARALPAEPAGGARPS
ncbi:MAG: MFS transporter [Actinomycetota bacterium]|nr:MFS transporter [Actinomycetota bacterium]